MPPNSSLTILKRWQAMDAALAKKELNIRGFAKDWKVSQKTVRRDLEAFKKVGKKVQNRRGIFYDVLLSLWGYQEGVEPLFSKNRPRRGR